jgi:hypothetical protein
MHSNGRLTLLALAAALALVAACTGGSDDVTSPAQEVSDVYYVRAHFELLDAAPPCTVAPCPPEFLDCADRSPVAIGRTWDVHANVVAVGWLSPFAQRDPGAPQSLALSATDTARRTALTFEVQLDPRVTLPVASFVSPTSTFVDVLTGCSQLNGNNAPESRFVLLPGTPVLTVSEAAVVTVRDGADADPALDPEFVAAIPQAGAFNPEGVLAGTFGFDAVGAQQLPTGNVAPRLRVTGCFRVPVPDLERGVPVAPEPAGVTCP